MYKEPYEERTHRIVFAVPKKLYHQAINKLPLTNYTNISELCRALLRKWVETEMVEVKKIG